jgi:hypothetical protein
VDHSYTNLQIKSSDPDAVRRAIELCNIGSAKMLARKDVEWIGVYPFMTEDDFSYLKETTEKMSAQLELPVFGFMVPRGEVFRFVLFDTGKMLDEYDSSPAIDPTARGGTTAILLRHCLNGTSADQLEELLRKPDTADSQAGFGDRTASGMARLLGIPRAQMCTGYNYLKWAQAGR